MKLRQGEVVSLLGPSGSGKTTLLRAVAGLEMPHRGTIRIDGQGRCSTAQRGVDVPAEKRNLGLVFQSYALWPHRTVFDNVAYGLKLRSVRTAEIATRVATALRNLGLGHLGERFPHQLSGGQQQRVAIARALVYNPPVILMDEPLSNLDAKLREEARAWLRELIVAAAALGARRHPRPERGAGDVGPHPAAEQRPHRAAGHAARHVRRPADAVHRRIHGQQQPYSGRGGRGARRRGAARRRGLEPVGPLRVAGTAAGGDGTGMIRLERMRIADGPGDNRLQARLTASMYLGDHWEHLFHLGGMTLRAHTPGRLEGEAHWLDIPPDDLWVF